MFNIAISVLAEKVLTNGQITREEALSLTRVSGADLFYMIACAGKIREKETEDRVFSCAIINAKSGRCSENCAYCAQSSFHNTGISTYPMLGVDEILESAVRMEKQGATRFSMVTSGFMAGGRDLEIICRAAEAIRKATTLKVCASLGELTLAMAKQLRSAGVSNYHHNLETAESHFDKICTTHEYSDDVETVEIAKQAGFSVCSGGILGLGETWEQRVELAFTLRTLDVDTVPINFLNPVRGTPMQSRPLVPPVDALKSIALFRFINPTKNITICGGREKTLKEFQSWIFTAGANALMGGDYLTTKGRNMKTDMEMINDLGLRVVA
jgi:biotin synthase